MYSGSTLKHLRHFDAWFGAHQKIDRVARDHLAHLLKDEDFPTRKQIIRFEGMDGPDGIKRKTPAKDEPWHFLNPNDAADTQLYDIISGHYRLLVRALRETNGTRASFEAAWLAHAIVDGLTPAHHYPYEEELIRLRGAGNETRNSPKEKLLMPGDTLPKRLSNNWQMWGDKGLLATHIAFEIGVAVMIMPLRLRSAMPLKSDIEKATSLGVQPFFAKRAKEVAAMELYEQFYKSGWTPRLAKRIRQELMPLIINTVTLAWYLAVQEANSR